MAEFITLTDANVTDSAFWAGLDLTVNSTLNVSGISDDFQVTMDAGSITFTDTVTGIVTSYSNGDLSSGSFSEIVQYTGNNNDSDLSGAAGLNSSGYSGGTGDDTFVDDGTLGGGLSGGGGADTITGGSGGNNIDGGAGDDILHAGSGGYNVVEGGLGNDTLYAGTGGGTLLGGDGNDTIYAGENTTFVLGGDGNDTLYLPEGSIVDSYALDAGNVTLPGGGTFTYQSIENVFIMCFVEGTKLRTPSGEINVEDIKVGDPVDTLDHGAQPVSWIGKRTIRAVGNLAPIVFTKGAIGNTRELAVSPQHRVLVRDWKAELLFGEFETLVAAKHLVNGDTIYASEREQVTYHHILFEKHEIVFSEGAETESFYPGKTSLDGMEQEARDEIFALFPELADLESKDMFLAARPFLKRFEANLLSQ